MNLGDLAGVGKAQKLRQLAGGKAARLQLRSHGSIEEQELLATQHGREVLVAHATRAGNKAILWPARISLCGTFGAHDQLLSPLSAAGVACWPDDAEVKAGTARTGCVR